MRKTEKEWHKHVRSEDAVEQHAARLEDTRLRAQHLVFAKSGLLCSQLKEYNRLRMAERCQQETALQQHT
ncbi:hypothetical protein TNCV_2995371 [Trichonephila clavipes]|nr:hypothetical protein TNCV_2995371 [Trichonephila clavipes]